MKGTNWQDLPIGGTIVEAGNSFEYLTGGWRSHRPVIDKERCTNCLFCWLYCPDGAIIVEEEKVKEIDLAHCKGCGVCAQTCPVKCIEMHEESTFVVEVK